MRWRLCGVRKTIAIDASYISKAGKKNPDITKFWSGCAGAMTRGLEILVISDVDLREYMMLRIKQTPDKTVWHDMGDDYNLLDRYLGLARRDTLLCECRKGNPTRILSAVVYWTAKILYEQYLSATTIFTRPGLRPNRTLNAKLVNELFGLMAYTA